MMGETIILNGHPYTRMYCVCGYEYKVCDHDTADDFVYEIEYHRAVHPFGWDIAVADYFLELDQTWRKLERTRG